MYLGRITTLLTNNTMSNYVQNSTAKYYQLAEEVSSGEKSDVDAVSTVNILNTSKKLNQLNGYNKNMTLAQNELNVLDSSLGSVGDALQKANELATQAANGTCDQNELDNIKTQVDQLLNSVIDLSNTNYNGNYIFSGANTSQEAYSVEPNGNIVYNGTPSTGQWQRYVQIADGVEEPINMTGDTIFGSYTAAVGTEGTPGYVAPSGTGIIGTLKLLSNALAKGDSASITSSLDSIKTNLDDVSIQRTTFAAISNRFDLTTNMNTNMIDVLTEYKSSLQDVDMTSALTEMASQQMAMQASLSATSKILSISLLDYM